MSLFWELTKLICIQLYIIIVSIKKEETMHEKDQLIELYEESGSTLVLHSLTSKFGYKTLLELSNEAFALNLFVNVVILEDNHNIMYHFTAPIPYRNNVIIILICVFVLVATAPIPYRNNVIKTSSPKGM